MALLSCARLESIGGSSSSLSKVESFSDQCDPGCRRFQFGHIRKQEGAWPAILRFSYTNSRQSGFGYDNAGNLTNDLVQTMTYDVTGQQTSVSYGGNSVKLVLLQ